MKRHLAKSSTLVAIVSLTCLIGTVGCKTFNMTDEDVERDHRFAREGYNNYWARGLSANAILPSQIVHANRAGKR